MIYKVEYTTNMTPEQVAKITELLEATPDLFVENLHITPVGEEDNEL